MKPRCPSDLDARRAALVAVVKAEKATIRQARARLGAAKAKLVALEAESRRREGDSTTIGEGGSHGRAGRTASHP